MTKTLQSELLKVGLVDQSEERSGKDRSYIQRKLDNYPSNRLGKPVQWAKWLVRRRIPKNASRRCCLCGLSVRKERRKELTQDENLTIKIKQEFVDKNIEFNSPAMLCKNCVRLTH